VNVSGRGVDGDPAAAKLVDESVRIFLNTTGNPLYATVNGRLTPIVLGSYGLMVNTHGLVAQLVPNHKGATRAIVGMSTAPSIWIVNFVLIYMLNPSLAAKMAARWTPIPPTWRRHHNNRPLIVF
jgi:hypothetical protein